MLGVDSGLVLEEEEGEEEEEEEKERIGIGSDVIRTLELGKWKAEEKMSQKREKKGKKDGHWKGEALAGGGVCRTSSSRLGGWSSRA